MHSVLAKSACLLLTTVGLFAGSSHALAQNAPTNLLLPTGNSVPQTDEDLNGIEDQIEDNSQPRVIFSDPIGESDTPDEQDVIVRDESGPADLTSVRSGNTLPQNTLRASQPTTPTEGNPRVRRADQVGIIDADGSVTPLANTRVRPEQGGNAATDATPYAPLGIRVGTFTLSPVITQTLGVTSNADFSANGNSSAFSQTDARLTVVSDWALHELRGEIGGSYQTFFNGTSEDLPRFDANMQLRFDHSGNLRTTLGANYALTTESAVSDNLTVPPPLSVTERPNVHRYGGFGEIAKQSGRLNTSIRGTITHSVFEGAALSNGSTLPQGDRTNTFYEARARIGYETSPSLQPFVEAALGWRNYRYRVDRNGNTRDSMIYALRGGLTFNQGEKLNGEIALGYSSERYTDPAIDNLNGLTVDANINWSPLRFTTITATAQTAFTGSTNANEAGSVTYAASLGLVHDVRPNLSLSASILASIRDYDGSNRQDETVQLNAGAEWRLNRNAALIGGLGYETVESTDADSSYDALTGRLGLRWQY